VQKPILLFGFLDHYFTCTQRFLGRKKDYFCLHIFALLAESNEWCVHCLCDWMILHAHTLSLSMAIVVMIPGEMYIIETVNECIP